MLDKYAYLCIINREPVLLSGHKQTEDEQELHIDFRHNLRIRGE